MSEIEISYAHNGEQDALSDEQTVVALRLLARWATRRAQRIARERQGKAVFDPTIVKSNGYRRRNLKK